MPETSRREFIATAVAGAALGPTVARAAASASMTMDLTPGAIGIEGGQRHVIELAARHGFQSVAPLGAELQARSSAEVADFLGALRSIGYDGPVRAEPFNKALNAMDDDAAAGATAAALKKAFALRG